MKRFMGLMITLLCFVGVTSCTDAKALTLEDMSVSYLADSMAIRVPIKVPVGSDSAVVTMTLVPGGTKTLKATPQTIALVFTFPAAPYGQPFTAQACGKPYWGTAAGVQSCNVKQTFTRKAPSDTLTWPDSMTISQMTWPDSASLALINKADADAMPLGPLAVMTTADSVLMIDTVTVNDSVFVIEPHYGPGGEHLIWARWGNAILTLQATNDANVGLAARNWREIRTQALAFVTSPKHRQWWDSVKVCNCTVYLPVDSVEGVKL